MPLTTDSVLLGSWSARNIDTQSLPIAHILDIGSGTGIVAFIVAQRFPQAHVCGIDIHQSSVELASSTAQQSFFSGRVSFKCQDITTSQNGSTHKDSMDLYDLVLCNPPYYKGINCKDQDRDRTRTVSNEGLSPTSIFQYAPSYLRIGGLLSLVTPIEWLGDMRRSAVQHLFYLTRLSPISSVQGSQPIRILTEWKYRSINTNETTQIDPISLFDCLGKKTPQFSALTSELYL